MLLRDSRRGLPPAFVRLGRTIQAIKKPARRPAFSFLLACASAQLLRGGFGRLGGFGGSSSRSGGSSRSGFGGGRSRSGGRGGSSRSGFRYFFAAGSNANSQQSGEEDGVFHLKYSLR